MTFYSDEPLCLADPQLLHLSLKGITILKVLLGNMAGYFDLSDPEHFGSDNALLWGVGRLAHAL